jgi:glycosyltransferase involved in cell wall biosynthesis
LAKSRFSLKTFLSEVVFSEVVKRLDLIGQLKWIPYLQYDRMPGIYSLMAASGGCHVTTSVIEPFGMTAIEALACQCPVVASRVGGFKEVIEDGQKGLLYNVNDTQEAISKIETVMDDVSKRACFVRNGRAAVEGYSSERVLEKYWGVLTAVSAKSFGE